MIAADDLPGRWHAYKQEVFAVEGLPDDATFDEADCAFLDATVAGFIDRAVGKGHLTHDEVRELEALVVEVRRRLPDVTDPIGHEQMRTLALLADAACRYRR